MEDQITGAEQVRWDLTQLYRDRSTLEEDIESAAIDARSFAESYRGRIGSLRAEEFARAMADLASIQDRAGRAYTYAYLHWSTDTLETARGALLQSVRERYTAIVRDLLFFDLEWCRVDDEAAVELLAAPPLAPYRHHLEVVRLQRPHLLSEPEEAILVEKGLTGRSAWTRYFDESVGAIRYDLDGRTLTQQEILALLHDGDRNRRRDAALAFTKGLEENLRSLTFVFNTLLADKSTDDRLRRYESWLSSRHASNEVDAAVVGRLVDAVVGGYPLVGRFYRLKRRLLGLEELADYDRYAPVGDSDRRYTWPEARAVVEEAFSEFHTDMGQIAARFFDERWIDAALGPGKRSGAFSHGAVPSAHPYVLLNYTGRSRDVQTLAHELGHGVHQFLSRKQGIFHADTPLTTAETASVFGEMLVFQRLLAAEEEPSNRLAMLVGKIDDTIATVFRQVAMNRFEDRVHTARREQGELTTDQFSAHWMDTQRPMFDGEVVLGEHYASWWAYIPHFLHTPGYVYAYAFGELLVLALHASYVEAPDGFAERYADLLSAGGSDWPHALVGRMGIDLNDPGFWTRGLQSIAALIGEAEDLADTLGY